MYQYGYTVKSAKYGLPGGIQVYQCDACGAREYFIKVKVEDLHTLRQTYQHDRQEWSKERAKLNGRLRDMELETQMRSRLRRQVESPADLIFEAMKQFDKTLRKALREAEVRGKDDKGE